MEKSEVNKMINKKFALIPAALLAIPFGLADCSDSAAYGMMGNYGSPLGPLYGAIWFAIGAVVFSTIFWYSKKLIMDKKARNRR